MIPNYKLKYNFLFEKALFSPFINTYIELSTRVSVMIDMFFFFEKMKDVYVSRSQKITLY